MSWNVGRDWDLDEIFHEWNHLVFDRALPMPNLLWNTRLRSAAGRFSVGRWVAPKIEIAHYLTQVKPEIAQPKLLVRDTLGHEMIHYWLWWRGRPFGHTPEFRAMMKKMGVSRYNALPKRLLLK